MTDFEKLIAAAKQGDIEVTRVLLQGHPEFIDRKDETGATALHHAAFYGHRTVVSLLVERGADVNVRDNRFGATPTGWAVEYLRELGGFLSIELEDLAYAIERGDVDWVGRFLRRFPALARARNSDGQAFKSLADESGNPEIATLFESGNLRD